MGKALLFLTVIKNKVFTVRHLKGMGDGAVAFFDFILSEIPNLLQILTSALIFVLVIKVWGPDAAIQYAHYILGAYCFVTVYVLGRAWFYFSKKLPPFNWASSIMVIVLLAISCVLLFQLFMKIFIPLSVEQGFQNCLSFGHCDQTGMITK